MTLVEICVEEVAGARIAEHAGADRIELCSNLRVGGLTPSIGMVTVALTSIRRAGVQVLIRPRAGDFVYDCDEVDAMCADIRAISAVPALVPVGFVLNALTADRRIDVSATARLLEAASGAPTTFSRAFDEVANRDDAFDDLAQLGFDRVLTAGGPGSAEDGLAELTRLAERTGPRVLAAGGVRSHNVADLVAATRVPEVHLRATRADDPRTSDAEVRAVIDALERID